MKVFNSFERCNRLLTKLMGFLYRSKLFNNKNTLASFKFWNHLKKAIILPLYFILTKLMHFNININIKTKLSCTNIYQYKAILTVSDSRLGKILLKIPRYAPSVKEIRRWKVVWDSCRLNNIVNQQPLKQPTAYGHCQGGEKCVENILKSPSVINKDSLSFDPAHVFSLCKESVLLHTY